MPMPQNKNKNKAMPCHKTNKQTNNRRKRRSRKKFGQPTTKKLNRPHLWIASDDDDSTENTYCWGNDTKVPLTHQSTTKTPTDLSPPLDYRNGNKRASSQSKGALLLHTTRSQPRLQDWGGGGGRTRAVILAAKTAHTIKTTKTYHTKKELAPHPTQKEYINIKCFLFGSAALAAGGTLWTAK